MGQRDQPAGELVVLSLVHGRSYLPKGQICGINSVLSSVEALFSDQALQVDYVDIHLWLDDER